MEVLLQYQISKNFHGLFAILNDHHCRAQPAFVPGEKDLVPQNSLFSYSLTCSFSLQHPFDHFVARQDLALKLSQV